MDLVSRVKDVKLEDIKIAASDLVFYTTISISLLVAMPFIYLHHKYNEYKK